MFSCNGKPHTNISTSIPRYAVATQLESFPDWKSDAIVGSEVETMVWSRKLSRMQLEQAASTMITCRVGRRCLRAYGRR